MKAILKYMVLYFILQIAERTVLGQVMQPEYDKHRPAVAAIARSMGDSILIRWAPDDPLLWNLGNKYGYRVVRTKVMDDKKILYGEQRYTKTTADSVRPYKLTEIDPLVEIDRYAAIVGQAIYGEDFEISSSFDKSPVGNLDKSRDLQDRFSFALFSADQSVLAAKVHGLWFTDIEIERNATYLYSVFPLIPPGIIDFDTAFVVCSEKDTVQLPVPYDLNATFGDKYVELSWNREYLQQYYTSYIVERSDDNGSTFIRTNESPYLNILTDDQKGDYTYKVDSLPENNKTYFFRIRGRSPFGETGPPSQAIAGMGVTKPGFLNPIIIRNEPVNDVSVLIEWELPVDAADEISAFEVSRSTKSEGPFTIISTESIIKSSRNFIDYMPLKRGFYRVASIDKLGEKHYSFPAMVLLPDSLPPTTPSGFKGTVDSSGIVKFSWNSCNEDDLAGYRLYRSNYYSDGYVKINNNLILLTNFCDTISLGTITRKVFYKLTAIDNHFNESEPTSVLIVDRPDTIPPASPVFSKYSVKQGGIELSWHRSPSMDVNEHILFRQKLGELYWERIYTISDSTQKYTDTTHLEPVVYKYQIIAVDSSGLESEPSKSISIKALESQIINVITEFKAMPERDGKSIRLVWKGFIKTNSHIAIYKSENSEPPVLYRTVEGDQLSFSDTNVKIGSNYTYLLQIITPEGKRSPLENKITISL